MSIYEKIFYHKIKIIDVELLVRKRTMKRHYGYSDIKLFQGRIDQIVSTTKLIGFDVWVSKKKNKNTIHFENNDEEQFELEYCFWNRNGKLILDDMTVMVPTDKIHLFKKIKEDPLLRVLETIV